MKAKKGLTKMQCAVRKSLTAVRGAVRQNTNPMKLVCQRNDPLEAAFASSPTGMPEPLTVCTASCDRKCARELTSLRPLSEVRLRQENLRGFEDDPETGEEDHVRRGNGSCCSGEGVALGHHRLVWGTGAEAFARGAAAVDFDQHSKEKGGER